MINLLCFQPQMKTIRIFASLPPRNLGCSNQSLHVRDVAFHVLVEVDDGVVQQHLGLDLAATPLVVGVVLVHHQVGVDVEDGHGLGTHVGLVNVEVVVVVVNHHGVDVVQHLLDLAAKHLVVGVVLVHLQVGIDVEDGHILHIGTELSM